MTKVNCGWSMCIHNADDVCMLDEIDLVHMDNEEETNEFSELIEKLECKQFDHPYWRREIDE